MFVGNNMIETNIWICINRLITRLYPIVLYKYIFYQFSIILCPNNNSLWIVEYMIRVLQVKFFLKTKLTELISMLVHVASIYVNYSIKHTRKLEMFCSCEKYVELYIPIAKKIIIIYRYYCNYYYSGSAL